MFKQLSLMALGILVISANLTTSTTAYASTQLIPLPNATFQQLNGSPMSLSELKGTVVLLNFWGTWCAPCLQEIPGLIRLSHQFKTKGLEVVGIALDSGHPHDIRAFMTEHGMDYSILMGDMALVKKQFHVMGFPTSLLIDRQGKIRQRYFGPQTEEVFKHDVEQLLE